jgi:hypothetical protein
MILSLNQATLFEQLDTNGLNLGLVEREAGLIALEQIGLLILITVVMRLLPPLVSCDIRLPLPSSGRLAGILLLNCPASP